MAEFDRSGQSGFTAAIVRASSAGLASAAAQHLLTADGGPVSGGHNGFGEWRASLETHLDVLAAALAAERPTIFHEHVRWAKWACLARDVTAEELRASLLSLATVLRGELPPQAGEAAAEWVQEAIGELDRAPDEPASRLRASSTHGELAGKYLLALLDGNRDEAVQSIDRARESGMPITEIYTEILAPALEEVGRMWMLGEAHVSEEHFATATTSLVISSLFSHLPRRPAHGKTVLTISVEGELHELGIRMVSDFFTMDGWRVVHLGASVPAGDLRRGIVDFEGDLVAISVSLPTHIDRVRAMVAEIRSDPKTEGVPIIVGGRAFDGLGDLWRELGADGTAAGLSEVVEVGRDLVGLDRSGD